MAQATDTVWLPVLPSMKGFSSALVKGAGSETDKQGKVLGGRLGTAMAVGLAASAAGIAAVSTILYQTGKTFDDVNNTIRVGTGASGAELEKLNDVAKSVGQNVPAEWDKIATTVADLNTRLGLSGDTLDKVARQYLEAGRILGEDVDIEKTSKAFNAFGIEGEGVSDAMDHLFRVSQATGISMNDLASAAQSNAPAMQGLGFSFEETTALIGNLDKAGLNSGKMMAGMSRALVELAKDGEEPQEAFRRVTGEIQGFLEEGDKAAAIDLAAQLFGTRNATQFIAALESGALAMDDLGEVAGMTNDTILEAGQETMQFAEQWQLFKNNVMVWLEPLATRVFGAINDALAVGVQGARDFMDAFQGGDAEGWFADLGSTVRDAWEGLKDFGRWISDNRGPISGFAAVIGGLVGSFLLYRGAVMGVTAIKGAYTAAMAAAAAAQRGLNAAMRANPIGIVITAIGGLVAGLTWLFTQTEIGQKIWETVWDAISTATSWAWDNVIQPVWDAMKWAWDVLSAAISWAWENIIKPAWDALVVFAQWMWENVIQPVWSAIQWAWEKLSNAISWAWENIIKPAWDALVTVLTWLWENVVSPIFNWIMDLWSTLSRWFMSVWNNVLSPVFSMVIAIITWLWNNVAKPYFKSVWEAWVTVGTFLWDTWTDYIWPAIQRFGDRVMDLWNDYISPALGWISDNWEDLKDTLVSVWENHIQPMLQNFGDFFLDEVVPRVEDAVDLIAAAWDTIKKAFGTPVHFVLDTIWNNGIVRAFNFVADLLPGADPLSKVDVSGIPKFAKGGLHKGGWALVGEEGPELVNFSNPGRVYTADDTRDMLGGTDAPMTPEEAAAAAGDRDTPFGIGNWLTKGIGWIADATGISGAIDWARGKLADGFRAAMKPISDIIAGAMEGRGPVGTLGSGFFDWAVDGIAGWIDAEDGVPDVWDGEFTANPGGFNRPANGPITSPAGPRSYIGRFGNMHYGVDIGVPIGSAIRSAFDGVIKSRGGGGLNQIVVVNHGAFDTAYMHNSAITRAVGTRVSGGDVIARSGTAGSGPHLHFELHPGGYYNPSISGVNSLFRDKGGPLYPGLNMVLNNTGKIERTFNDPQFDNLNAMAARLANGEGGRNVTVNQYGIDYQYADRNAQAIKFTERREMRKAGVR